MKLMIASDIHGSAHYCSQLLEAMDRENPEKLLLLGDILYHGPRNDLPMEYAPKKVIQMLNARKTQLMSVQGNCDSDVDQMVLEFPILAEYCLIPLPGGRTVFATHGHKHNKAQMPPLQKGDILLHGHTHVPACEDVDGVWYLNPGSVSIPKEDSWHGYMMLEDTGFVWKDLDGTVQKVWNL